MYPSYVLLIMRGRIALVVSARGWSSSQHEGRKARFSRRRLRRTSMPKQSLTKRTMVRIHNKTVARWQQLCY
jgi:hypothetical protein